MEAAASVAVAARGVSLTMPSSQSQSSRKEWRVVSDHPVQNSGNDDLDRSKLGQGDERLVYEGRESVNGGSDHELRLDDVVKQREQLQHLEVNLKARLIARSEVMGMQERFDSQIKEHITASVKLQEQLHEREKAIMELQRTLDDKDKELHAIRLDHEAAWAKEDLLREQNKELATFRRERDNAEAERAQHLQKIHDLQEHVQEKERQFLELQEQHRVAQETLIYKDEQIREAQAWIARVQEMDALQSNTNHSLQAELRERTEQYNQLWVGCQRQFAEMERLHLHTLQQLEIELSEARERNGTISDGTRTSHVKDVSHFVHNNGSQLEGRGGNSPAGDSRGVQNGDAEIVSSQNENVPAVQVAPQSMHGMPAFFSPGQLAPLHPYILHHQGLPQNVNSHLVQSHVGQFHSVPTWQNQQAISESLQIPIHEQYSSQNDQNSLRQYEASVNEQSQQNLQQISSQFHDSLRLNDSDNGNLHQQGKNASFLSSHGSEAQSPPTEQQQLGSGGSIVSEVIQSVKVSEGTSAPVQERYAPSASETKMGLFDEETLLACVVRTIPPAPGGRIQISSTLLSRLTKMLAPLRWSDYENRHGKLVAFLGSHPELFVIEGDYIQVREGAQEIIAAMVAHAKVRAAAVADSATSSNLSLLSSVAVTPMARTRLKKTPLPAVTSNYGNANGVGVRLVTKQNDQMRQNGRPTATTTTTPNYNGKQQQQQQQGGRSRGSFQM
ncbi:uncharacterized protein LOC111920395 isoform X3 [Lactuca sativa]|uniref:uncharacterized protein LOC111920395 isoform X3 n=1 Tax=Lactuca sativa TaxID=4236 RepID=UPI000CD952FF|nr:uncharacterized protein LOC111920395 isoform X3 [Lactuca sativa]